MYVHIYIYPFHTHRADPTSGFPFKSVVPLWSRQIPYTMAKFYFFEKVKEIFYESVFTAPKESYSKGTHLGIYHIYLFIYIYLYIYIYIYVYIYIHIT
jgi:hypothetical protein